MGNGESSSMGSTCGGSSVVASEPIGVNVRIPKTPAEIDAWLREVKSSVCETVELQEDRYKRYLAHFRLTDAQIIRATEAYVDELEIGLECHQRHPYKFVPSECSFKMLDSCVDMIPTGKEEGVYYALDFGGSNFRVVRLQMKNGEIKETFKKASLGDAKVPLPKGLMDPKATATQMFGFFARTVKDFMLAEGDLDRSEPFQCGFTFSFPCSQRSIDQATLISWTKGFETGRQTNDPVEGLDVAELMNVAFKRENVPMHINAVANDTVGTLLSCAYSLDRREHPPCLVGLILGTGYNACYFDQKALEYGYKGTVINIESGNFNRELPTTSVDHAVDFADVGGRGKQHFEKLVAGGYLGEIVRCSFVKILQHRAPGAAHVPYSFSSEDAAVIISDKSSNLISAQKIVLERWSAELEIMDLQMLREISMAIFDRSAALAAVAICGSARRTGFLQEARGGLSVGIDGSLYKCNGFYRMAVQRYLNIILKDQAPLVHLLFAEDGSGRGAGILSAVIDCRRKPDHHSDSSSCIGEEAP